MDADKIREEIRRAREKMGLTQAELAEKLGVSGKTVYRWETGQRDVKLDTLDAIATR